MKNIHKYPLST